MRPARCALIRGRRRPGCKNSGTNSPKSGREPHLQEDGDKPGNMDGASAIAGLISLAALVLQTTLQIRGICEEYSSAKEDVDRVSDAIQSLQNLLQETQRLAETPEVFGATAPLTRTR